MGNFQSNLVRDTKHLIEKGGNIAPDMVRNTVFAISHDLFQAALHRLGFSDVDVQILQGRQNSIFCGRLPIDLALPEDIKNLANRLFRFQKDRLVFTVDPAFSGRNLSETSFDLRNIVQNGVNFGVSLQLGHWAGTIGLQCGDLCLDLILAVFQRIDLLGYIAG